MNDARLGMIPKVETAVKTIEEMADIMISDRNAILGLTMLSSYDNYTFNHSVNVGILALSLAQHLEHSETLQMEVGVAGLLHDIGKTFTPLTVLNKPGPLSDDEWEIIRRHPLDGTRLIEKMEGPPPGTSTIVLEHHMGYNLRGYPNAPGPNHKQHPGTGIVTISDCYDSMTTLRAYQERLEPREALKKMNNLAGKHFDPTTLKSFIQMLGIYPIGSLVRLNSGEIALVTGVESGDPNHPRVKIVTDRDGKKLSEYREMKLSEDPQGREIITTVDFMAKDVDLSL
jgi:putative nucleotidyltransferase with HDIG domain